MPSKHNKNRDDTRWLPPVFDDVDCMVPIGRGVTESGHPYFAWRNHTQSDEEGALHDLWEVYLWSAGTAVIMFEYTMTGADGHIYLYSGPFGDPTRDSRQPWTEA